MKVVISSETLELANNFPPYATILHQVLDQGDVDNLFELSTLLESAFSEILNAEICYVIAVDGYVVCSPSDYLVKMADGLELEKAGYGYFTGFIITVERDEIEIWIESIYFNE